MPESPTISYGRWVGFGVLIGLLPLGFAAMALLNANNLVMDKWIGHGELLLVAVGVAAAGAGQVLGRTGPNRYLIAQLVVTVACLLLIALASYEFGEASAGRAPARVVVPISLGLYIVALITGGLAIYTSRLK
jgi:NADH:ubiquinone oxidoreductase subunit 6 (subunit J)